MYRFVNVVTPVCVQFEHDGDMKDLFNFIANKQLALNCIKLWKNILSTNVVLSLFCLREHVLIVQLQLWKNILEQSPGLRSLWINALFPLLIKSCYENKNSGELVYLMIN